MNARPDWVTKQDSISGANNNNNNKVKSLQTLLIFLCLKVRDYHNQLTGQTQDSVPALGIRHRSNELASHAWSAPGLSLATQRNNYIKTENLHWVWAHTCNVSTSEKEPRQSPARVTLRQSKPQPLISLQPPRTAQCLSMAFIKLKLI